MTRAELARQIDERERHAESKAALNRALDYAARKRAEERARIDQWLGKEPPQSYTAPRNLAQRNVRSYEGFGECLTLLEWSTRYRVDLSLLRQRINSGWTVEDSLTVPYGERRRRPAKCAATHSYQGRDLTLKEWAAVTGLNASTIRNRLQAGRSPEQALTMPGRGSTSPVVFNFGALQGTGGHSTAQDSAEITFHSDATILRKDAAE